MKEGKQRRERKRRKFWKRRQGRKEDDGKERGKGQARCTWLSAGCSCNIQFQKFYFGFTMLNGSQRFGHLGD
jgi:hypothetical protein